jgi:hypothetical protein
MPHADDMPDAFGPWAGDLSEIERRLHWRAMTSLWLVLLAPGNDFTKCARQAEFNHAVAGEAWRQLLALPALPRRRVLSVWTTLTAMASEV